MPQAYKVRRQLYDPKAGTEDFQYEDDPNRNLQSSYAEVTGTGAAREALTAAFPVEDGYTLLISHIDFEAAALGQGFLEKSVDGGTNWTVVRQFHIPATENVPRDYEKAPFSFEGSDTNVQVRLTQTLTGRVSGGWNGKYIKT